jgi:hypothetical protein
MLGNVSLLGSALAAAAEQEYHPLTDMQSSSSRFVANIVPLQNVQTSVTGKNEVQTLQTSVTALQATVSALQATVAALQAQVAALQAKVG